MNNPRITALLAAVAQFEDTFDTIDGLLQEVSEEAAEACMDIRQATKHITEPVTLDRLQHEEDIAIEDEMSISGARELWWDIARKVNSLLPSISNRLEELATEPMSYDDYKRVEAHHSMPRVLPLNVLAARWGREGDKLTAQFSKDAPEAGMDAFDKLRERGFAASPADPTLFRTLRMDRVSPGVTQEGQEPIGIYYVPTNDCAPLFSNVKRSERVKSFDIMNNRDGL